MTSTTRPPAYEFSVLGVPSKDPLTIGPALL